MKIAIYTPYLDTFGGGERYMLSIAENLSKENEVDLLLDSHHLTLEPKTLIPELGLRLDLDLSGINFVSVPMGKGINSIKRLLFFRKYDLLIYLTDGSIFYSTAKKSIIHFQVPFKNTNARGLWGNLKLSSWDFAICNSNFTKSHIKNNWQINTVVLYPPVEVEKLKPLTKEKWIVSVGRFTSFSKSKKHEEMIKTFVKMYKSGKIKNWSLHLAGSIEGDEEYINELKELAGDAPVSIYPSIPFRDLLELYGKSSIYWHAAGFGEDDPTKMEHFGITTVEAMAAGCVPVVINKGGQLEIVENGVEGYLWNNIDELQEYTYQLVENHDVWKKMSQKSLEKSKHFSKVKFTDSLKELLSD